MTEKAKTIDSRLVKNFWQLLKNTNPPKWIISIAILLSLIDTAAGLLLPWFTKELVDQMTISAFRLSSILLIIAAFIVQTIAAGFSFYLISYIGEWVVASIRRKLWAHVIKLPISYFDNHESGETMSRVSQDTNTVKTLITQHFVTFVSGVISIIGAVIILFIIDWKITLFMILAVPISAAILMPLGQKMYKVSKATQDEMADFSAHLGRVLTEIRLTKAYHAEKIEQEKGEKGINKLFRLGLKEAKILAVISPFMGMVIMLMVILLIGYGGIRVASGSLTAGSLVAIIIYLVQIVVPFSQIATFFAAFQKALGATERIQTILSMEGEKSLQNKTVENGGKPIIFNGVSFSYKEKMPVLKNITFLVPPGKTTALVGPSGSGKTTIFSLLERFYTEDEGEILYGGEPIHSFSLNSWRKLIGYVSQESPIMSGTIRDNIAYGFDGEVADEKIMEAARLANAAEFIEQLPQGLDTEVGERGITLSGGQRQRIAIARAILKNPKILLLDEATSNLDSESEHLVQEALNRIMEGRTTLIIAHRLSTVVDADQIIVLDKGRITAVGTHDELLEKSSLYRKLAEQQLVAAT